MTRRLAVAAVVVLAAALASPARAEDQALVRVIAEVASIRTGPGFGYRTVYRANQGEVLTVIGRATHDHWFRVELPDGTYGWILGDEVFPLDVDTAAAHQGPSICKRMGTRVFSPSPLMIENVTLHVLGRHPRRRRDVPVPAGGPAGPARFAGGDHRRDGRQPSRRHLHGRRLQRLPVSVLAGDAVRGRGGGWRVRAKKADQFAIQTGNYSMVNVGGGLVMSLKKRISLRGDVRHYVIFNANHTQRIQEYSGALAVFSRPLARSSSPLLVGGCSMSKWTVKPHQRELLADDHATRRRGAGARRPRSTSSPIAKAPSAGPAPPVEAAVATDPAPPDRRFSALALAGSASRGRRAANTAEAAARVTMFDEPSNKNIGVRVIHPQADVSATVASTLGVAAGYSADVVSGATPATFDVVSAGDQIQ